MSNRVAIHSDGYIEQEYLGNQTEETLSATLAEMIAIIKSLQKQKRPIRILVNTEGLGKLSIASRKTAVTMLKKVAYDTVAVYGSNTFNRALANLIIQAAGKEKSVKVFSTKTQALDWLLHENT